MVHRLSYSAACGILVPVPGIEFESPVLEGGLLTTGLPGKPLGTFLFAHFHLSVPSQLSALVFKRYLGRGAFGTLEQAGKVLAPASSFLS